MNQQKIFFPNNVKFLRERKNLTQEHLANLLGITRSKLNALESGQTKAPQPDDYINFSKYFKISIDTLIQIDLSKLGELRIRELESGNDVYMRGGQLRVLAISVDKNNKENVEYVPVKAKAGYVSGYNDPEFIASLPKFSMPNLAEGGTFRMFPISGDSMLPIPDGSDVIAEYVEDWKNIKTNTPCIVILKGEQEFVFKQVTIQTDGSMLLTSLNTLYHPYTVANEEVLEVWKYYKYITHELPEPATDLQEVRRLILEVRQDIQGATKTT